METNRTEGFHTHIQYVNHDAFKTHKNFIRLKKMTPIFFYLVVCLFFLLVRLFFFYPSCLPARTCSMAVSSSCASYFFFICFREGERNVSFLNTQFYFRTSQSKRTRRSQRVDRAERATGQETRRRERKRERAGIVHCNYPKTRTTLSCLSLQWGRGRELKIIFLYKPSNSSSKASREHTRLTGT